MQRANEIFPPRPVPSAGGGGVSLVDVPLVVFVQEEFGLIVGKVDNEEFDEVGPVGETAVFGEGRAYAKVEWFQDLCGQ